MAESRSRTILHITPHLGGGVGSVVLGWMDHETPHDSHLILSLDHNNNKDWQETNSHCGHVTILDACFFRLDFKTLLLNSIAQADIVVIHWWNHPLLYDILINFAWPPCRLVMWNHVSGLFAPYSIPERLVNFSDLFLFTSPVSYECAEIKNLPAHKKDKLGVIWSTVGIAAYDGLERLPHQGFIVGYTGTADYGKLHPEFIRLCGDVADPDIRFQVCSGDSQAHLLAEAQKQGIADRFEFLGRVPSIAPYLAQFDVFGYPLQPQHFATCEQALGEAMMAGCVPVVLDNATERHIVKHMETGLVASTLGEYPRLIRLLHDDPALRGRLAASAQNFARQRYDIQATIEMWHRTFGNLMTRPKAPRSWFETPTSPLAPARLYVESLGDHGKPLADYLDAPSAKARQEAGEAIRALFATNSMFSSRNKGSVFQYSSFFPADPMLKEWGQFA